MHEPPQCLPCVLRGRPHACLGGSGGAGPVACVSPSRHPVPPSPVARARGTHTVGAALSCGRGGQRGCLGAIIPPSSEDVQAQCGPVSAQGLTVWPSPAAASHKGGSRPRTSSWPWGTARQTPPWSTPQSRLVSGGLFPLRCLLTLPAPPHRRGPRSPLGLSASSLHSGGQCPPPTPCHLLSASTLRAPPSQASLRRASTPPTEFAKVNLPLAGSRGVHGGGGRGGPTPDSSTRCCGWGGRLTAPGRPDSPKPRGRALSCVRGLLPGQRAPRGELGTAERGVSQSGGRRPRPRCW